MLSRAYKKDYDSHWGRWLTDNMLREIFEKNSTFEDIRSIDLSGNGLITDQGIIWISQYFPKCRNLNKISLRSCGNLTENALWAIMNNLNWKCSIVMTHTNVNFVPKEALKYHLLNLDYAPMGYHPISDEKTNNVKTSLVIWPSKSVNISGIGLLTEKVARNFKGNYIEYKPKVNIFPGGPLVNIINYRYTEVPIHLLIPNNPGHVLILVSDNIEEAVSHIVDTVVHFLSSDSVKIGFPKFEEKIEKRVIQSKKSKKPSKKMEQKIMPSKKMGKSKSSYYDETEEAHYSDVEEDEEEVSEAPPQVTINVIPSVVRLLTQFTIVCYGPNCDKTYDEVCKIQWDQKVASYKIKLEELIETLKRKLVDREDIFDSIQLSGAVRQLDRVQEFINARSSNKILTIFKMVTYNEKVVKDVLTAIQEKMKEEQQAQPYRFVNTIFSSVAESFSNLGLNYVKLETLNTIETLNDYNRIPHLVEKMFSEMSCIYLKKFEMFIINVDWFDNLLNAIAKSPDDRSNYKALGVHGNTKVWTKSTITGLLYSNTIPECDHQMWIAFFMDMGLLIRIPCIRFLTNDEPYFFINPMESESGKIEHLENLRKSRDLLTRKLMATVRYTKVCQDLYSLYPQLLSRIISIGYLQLLSPLATVIHVSGGVELMIEAEEDSLTISSYMPQPTIKEGSDIMQMNLINYIWSVVHLCTDAFEAILIEQKIVSLKSHNRSEEPPQNYSICYNHKWTDSPTHINICSLCGNCSAMGMECPYNRIKSKRRGYCLCLANGSCCEDCGICKSCCQTHWTNHCTSHPGDLTPYEGNSSDLMESVINVATQPTIVIQTSKNDSRVFVGLKKTGFPEMLDLFGVSVGDQDVKHIVTTTQMSILRGLHITSITVSISEIDKKVMLESKRGFQYAVCWNADFNEDLRLLTYHHHTGPYFDNYPVGIFVGHNPLSEERNKFLIEIINAGTSGYITVGFVIACYPYSRQPGWDPYSIAYHGDDGGIYNSSGGPMLRAENFSEPNTRVEVLIEYTDSGSRHVIFKKNGLEMARVPIKTDENIFPAIGFHSLYEQVRLLDDLVWKCEQTTNEVLEDTADFEGLLISPKSIIRLNNSEFPTGFIHIIPGGKIIKTISIKVESSKEVLKAIRSLNNIPQSDLKDSTALFTLEDDKMSSVLTFCVEFNCSDWSLNKNTLLKLNVKTKSNNPIIMDLKVSNKKFLRDCGYKDHLYGTEVPHPLTPPMVPAYLLTVTENYKPRFFHITKENYSLVLKGGGNDIFIETKNLTRPSYTKSFEIGNIISFNSIPSMIVKVKKDENKIKITGHSEPISFTSDQIKPLSRPGKSLFSFKLSKHGKFSQIYEINKSCLIAPAPSRPSVSLFKDVKKIDDSDIYFTNECNKYHGMNICLLNLLSLYEVAEAEKEKCYRCLALPFNLESNDDFSHFLWEHSYNALLQCSNILFYPLCLGRSSIYDPQPHLIHIPGIKVSNESPDESDFFKIIFQNEGLLQAHKTILNNKLTLPNAKAICPPIKEKYMENEIEYHIGVILEKTSSFMLLINLLTNSKSLCNEKIDLNLGAICNKNYRSLTMDEDNLSCRLHSTNYLNEVDLKALADEYSGDVMSITSNPLLEYAEYSQSVVLTGNDLQTIPEKLFQRFSNLYSLELKNMNKIEALPESIYDVKGLIKLSISRVKLHTFPQIWRYPNLKQLNISYCPISTCDYNVQELRLESVRLISLSLTEIPKIICQSPMLLSLEIHLSGMETLPIELRHIQSLKELKVLGSTLYYNLCSEKIEQNQRCDEEFTIEYPEVVSFKLVELGKTISSGTTSVDAFINVPRLGSGYSNSGDKLALGGFPMALLSLINLTSLNIHYQSIRSVPKEIQNLKVLEYLDLSFNHLLESIPGELINIVSIKKVTLNHCPAMIVPPIEVISHGNAAILSYMKYLLAKKVTCNRTKLMFVGLGEAGKTSLLHALTSPDNKAKSLSEDVDITVTDGIDIGKYCIFLPNNESIQYSTWDFAGQDVYYNTHQFFLSSKAIYIVVWSVRQGIEHGDLDFWLSSITCHAKDAPVFIVGTRCDQVQAQISSFATLTRRYSQIVDFHLVDSYSGTGIEALRKNIVDVTMRLPYMHQDIPSSILDLDNKIVQLRSSKDYITNKEFEDISLAEGILEKDIKNVMQILHDFGSIQYFDTEFLRKYVVINPQWIVDIMANVVSVVDQRIVEGIFYHKDMCNVWKVFDSSLHNWMLSLTEEFDLTFPHPTIEPKANIVPCLLSEKEPQIMWPSFSDNLNWKYFQIQYTFDFLPAGLFNRIQVRLFDFTDTKEIWKYGTYFQKNEHHVLLKRENKTTVTIKAIGVRPTNVLAMVDEVLRSLIRTSFYGVDFQMEIACPDCIEYGTAESNVAIKYWSDICMFKSKVVKKAITKKVEYLQCAELHLNSLKSIKENTPDTPTPEDFVNDLYSKVQTVKGLYASSDKMVVMLHSINDFEPGPLRTDKLEKIFRECTMTCKNINETALNRWKALISNCSLCIIALSESFLKIKEMDDILDYVKLLKKSFLLIILSEDSQIKSTWVHGIYFNNVHIKMNPKSADTLEAKYTEFASTVKQICCDTTDQKTEYFDCFISYCWTNSQDAVNKGTKMVAGAATCAEADPRRVCKYLQDQGVSCWLDEDNIIKNLGLSSQLSLGLQESKMMIAFVSREYDHSDNCKMELRFMMEVLKRPVVYVRVGNNFDKFINSEVQLLMQKGDTISILDFTSTVSVSYENLLQTVKVTLNGCPQPIRKREQAKTDSAFSALNEQVELIFRQFLNQLIIYSEEHCPRLVVIDIKTPQDGMKVESSNVMFELRIICENEDGWHLVEDVYDISDGEKDILIESCAVYLFLIFQVLEYKNPGLRCLQTNEVNKNELIQRITQIANSSQMSLKDSYRNLIQFYMKLDPELKMCSLKRYRLASGRESWMCSICAASHNRCKLVERDAATQDSRLSPLYECDKEIFKLLKNKIAEEEIKYREHFKTVVEKSIQEMEENGGVGFKKALLPPPLMRYDTFFYTEKDIVTNFAETSVVPLRKIPTSKRSEDKSLPQSDNELKGDSPSDGRRQSSIVRESITGSRFCLIQ